MDAPVCSRAQTSASGIQETHAQLQGFIAQQAQALATLAHELPPAAARLVECLVSLRGRVIFTGLGKAGLVGRKLAATYASLGMPAFFVHPTELLHGDLGMVTSGDLVIALSKSGQGQELTIALPAMRQTGAQTALIGMHPGPLSTLVDLAVQLPFAQEACPHNLAPTTSTTLMMAFGDALALAASSQRGFTAQDFAARHPQGTLGRRLTATVQQFMHTELPTLGAEARFEQILFTITSKRLGVAFVVDQQGTLLGIITDGDLRRACQQHGPAVFGKTAGQLAVANPKTIHPSDFAYQALLLMERHHITSLAVTDDQKTLAGVVHLHDLVKAGIKP